MKAPTKEMRVAANACAEIVHDAAVATSEGNLHAYQATSMACCDMLVAAMLAEFLKDSSLPLERALAIHIRNVSELVMTIMMEMNEEEASDA